MYAIVLLGSFVIVTLAIVDDTMAKTSTIAQLGASPNADPGVMSLIRARYNTFKEIDHEIISTVILLLPLIQEGLLPQLQGKVCARRTG